MRKTISAVAVAAAVLLGAIYFLSGEFRSYVLAAWYSVAGWSEEARLAHPVEFARHAAGQLAEDLTALAAARQELDAELASLGRQQREQEQHRVEVATRIRELEALAEDEVTAEARDLLTILRERSEVLDGSLRELVKMETEIRQRRDALTVRMADTEAQRLALAARAATADHRSAATRTLLTRTDELLQANERMLAPAASSRGGFAVPVQFQRRAKAIYAQY